MGGQRHAPAALPPGKDQIPIVQEAGWTPGPIWTGAENLAPPPGIQSPDRPARSESLYRLSYPGPLKYGVIRGERQESDMKITCSYTYYIPDVSKFGELLQLPNRNQNIQFVYFEIYNLYITVLTVSKRNVL